MDERQPVCYPPAIRAVVLEMEYGFLHNFSLI